MKIKNIEKIDSWRSELSYEAWSAEDIVIQDEKIEIIKDKMNEIIDYLTKNQ